MQIFCMLTNLPQKLPSVLLIDANGLSGTDTFCLPFYQSAPNLIRIFGNTFSQRNPMALHKLVTLSFFTCVLIALSNPIYAVTAGPVHVVGNNNSGQLGIWDRTILSSTPRLVYLNQVSAGAYHSLALDASGDIWGCGTSY